MAWTCVFTHLRRAARSSGHKLSEVAREVAAGQPLPRGRTRPISTPAEQPKSDAGDPQFKQHRLYRVGLATGLGAVALLAAGRRLQPCESARQVRRWWLRSNSDLII
jgi:hypothetical protein